MTLQRGQGCGEEERERQQHVLQHVCVLDCPPSKHRALQSLPAQCEHRIRVAEELHCTVESPSGQWSTLLGKCKRDEMR